MMIRVSRHRLLCFGFWLGVFALACQSLAFAVSSAHLAYRLSTAGFIGADSICTSPGSPLASGDVAPDKSGSGSHCPVCGGTAGFALPTVFVGALFLLQIAEGTPRLLRGVPAPIDRRALRRLAARPPPLIS